MTEISEARCPICKEENNCGNLARLPAGACWCSKETFPQAVFERIPPELAGKACVCQACLYKLKHESIEESGGNK
ncbi:cysteine-rich CWC family protein [Paenibacillus lupini]|uniref:cysteine-rich CWC family protein n=1 Tax=Paenibacillus lupini TaxID=1450204 RepID=UPI001ABA9F31|nr:cysteine-rich CWC family protein [Paenibacillus lupini]NIK24512.1 hypothetical protein [Paenibacillus lupini]